MPTKQGPANRRCEADLAGRGIRFGGSDDREGLFAVAVRLDDHRGAEDNLAATFVARLDHDRVLDHLLELLDPAFQEGLLLARGFVVGVLTEVAEFTSRLDALDDLGPTAVGQLVQLEVEGGQAVGGQVDRRNGRSARIDRPGRLADHHSLDGGWSRCCGGELGDLARRRLLDADRWSGAAAVHARSHLFFVGVRQLCDLPDLGPRNGLVVVEWRSQTVVTALAARPDQNPIRQSPGGLDEGLEQGVFVQLRVRCGGPPDAGFVDVAEGLQPVAGRLRASLTERGLVHAGKASPYRFLAGADEDDGLARQPERREPRLQLADSGALAIEAEARREAQPFADRIRVYRDLGLWGGQLDDEDARSAACNRPTPQDRPLDGQAIVA